MARRLGKGLGSLLGQGRSELSNEESEQNRFDLIPQARRDPGAPGTGTSTKPGSEAGGTGLAGNRELPVGAIRPNPHQPREHFDPDALEELRNSIQAHGILQPIAVRPTSDGRYEIIAGERRWRAAQLAGLEAIPAVVRADVTSEQMLELALVENVQRKDLNPIERAQGYQNLVEIGLTQGDVAKKVGLNRTTIANHIRLLELAPKVREAVSKELITMGHARALLGVREPEAQWRLAERVVREDLSVRAVERFVRELARPKPGGIGSSSTQRTPEQPAWVKELERRIGDELGTRVSLRNHPGYRGQIVIEYFSREDLERLYSALAPRPTL